MGAWARARHLKLLARRGEGASWEVVQQSWVGRCLLPCLACLGSAEQQILTKLRPQPQRDGGGADLPGGVGGSPPGRPSGNASPVSRSSSNASPAGRASGNKLSA